MKLQLDRPIVGPAIACGTAVLVGWTLAEQLKGTSGHWYSVALTCVLVGGSAGVGLAISGALGLRAQIARRVVAGLVVGGFAGVVGGSLGSLLAGSSPWFRVAGWGVMGAGLGAASGLIARSTIKLGGGMAAGLIGGLIGGLGFHATYVALAPLSVAAGRGSAFVVLGAVIGASIGLARGLFAEAWLTVLDGDHARRRLVLDAPRLVIGRADHAALCLQGPGQQGVDLEHAIIRCIDLNRYELEDNHSRHGTSVNLTRVLDRVDLNDGDVIRIGPNSIRFRNRRRVLASEPPRPVDRVPAPTTPVERSGTASPRPPVAARPVPRGMSICPKCQRPVPGTRPYCVVCKLSF